MNGHENFNAAPTPPENDAERQDALERLRREEATSLLEFASAALPKLDRRRAGKVARLIALFSLASTLAFNEREPNNPTSPENAQLGALVGKNLAQPVSPNELDTLTKELIANVIGNSDARHAGELMFGNIRAYSDGGSYDDKKTENASAYDNLRGALPERAEKVLVRGGSISVITEGQTNQAVSINSSTHSAFALSGIAKGFDVIPVGEKLPFKGFGTSKEDALQNGLDGAASFFGNRVKTETSLESKTVDSKDKPRFTEKFNEHIQSLYGQTFHSYELQETKTRPDGMHEITLVVQPGRVIETDEPRDLNIIEKPKD